MNSKNLTDLLKILTVAIKENVCEEDKQKIQDFFSHLRCLSGCTGCRPMTKWIRPFLWR